MSVFTPISYDSMFWGIPKALVNFDSNGDIIRSYNISSVVKRDKGVFVVNFSNKMIDENYIVSITASSNSDLICGMIYSQSVESVTINMRGSTLPSGIVTNGLIDPACTCVVVF